MGSHRARSPLRRRARLGVAVAVAVSAAVVPGICERGAKGAAASKSALLAFAVLTRAPGEEGTTDVYVVRTDGSGGIRRLTSAGVAADPRWTRDGARIVYAIADGRWAVMDADGARKRRLRHGGLFSNDGRLVAVVTSAFDAADHGSAVIAISRADGSAARRVRLPTWVQHLDWSPDGARFAFEDGSARVWTVGADGRGRLPIAHGESPRWSPDGKSLLFLVSGRARSALYTVPSRGGRPRLIRRTAPGTMSFSAAWSPDGREIAYAAGTAYAPTGCTLHVVDIASGRERALIRPRAVSGACSDLDWQPR